MSIRTQKVKKAKKVLLGVAMVGIVGVFLAGSLVSVFAVGDAARNEEYINQDDLEMDENGNITITDDSSENISQPTPTKDPMIRA